MNSDSSDVTFVSKSAPSTKAKKGKNSKSTMNSKVKVVPSKITKKGNKTKSKTKLYSSEEDDDVITSEGDESYEAEDYVQPTITKKQSPGNKTIEQTYQKKTQLQHILLRPETYVGSTESIQQIMWIYDQETTKMIQKKITYVPGLYKIFDEIIVNACDNKQRDTSMDTLKVDINVEAGSISIWNNGKGIPIVMHKEHKVYVPELIFGHLLTGSNFDDKTKKTTGGRNGYGAKLANIFSKEFIVETADANTKQKYKQIFRNNMSHKEAPSITSWNKKNDYTCITFKPDLERFKMTTLDEDIVALFKKRVYDVAGVTDKTLKVILNGSKIEIKSFPEYVRLYQQSNIEENSNKDSDGSDSEGANSKKVTKQKDAALFDKPTERWYVGFALSDDGFQQVSFVNGICTTKGGQHVNYIADQITAKLIAVVKKRNKGDTVKPNYIKNHITVYVSALIDNPAFDSQTKESLTTRPQNFGSTYTLSDKFLKQIEKSGIVERILSYARYKQTAELQRKGGGGARKSKLRGISKLDDANYAGTAKSKHCTLIVTEGDSAKTTAISGLAVVGRDLYGVFPLKGKLLNVREASHAQILKNEEIQNLVKIMGLKYGQTYHDTKSLRYGHLLIMTDQDHDGSHIKGLVINFIHHFWPSLVQIDGFLMEFITPIVKCTKGNREKVVFYTIPEYEAWRASTNNGRGWRIKYYKGLGTSSAQEAKEYFSDLRTHRISFTYEGNNDENVIDMAFSKKRVEERKNWLREFEPGTHVDYDVDDMSYSEFINKELILYSMADNVRSIPSLVDGFKPSQRKVLFCCFKRNLKDEIKVAQLAGYVSEHSAYHHAEQSLTGTIVNLAQDFVGSNNINLLSPNGQFGTRLMGGKDAASPRYIFTNLEKVTRCIFDAKDNAILEYLDDDGQSIEPVWYMPIIPMVLVNGSDGIGTGWSSSIPNYNPRDIIAILRMKLLNEDQELPQLTPWYRGFVGDVEEKLSSTGSTSYILRGKYELDEDNATVVITELPVKTWTQSYKQFLEGFLENDTIKDFKENHTETSVKFTLIFEPDKLAKIQREAGGILKKFKLETSLSTSNMHLFDSNGKIRHYQNPMDILNDFFALRLDFYEKRKASMLKQLTQQIQVLENKTRFILAVISQELIISNRKRKDIIDQLLRDGYDPSNTSNSSNSRHIDESGEDDEQDTSNTPRGYDYLLNMQIVSLTKERVEKLQGELKDRENERDILESRTIENLWLADLDDLERLLNEYDEEQLEKLRATPTKPKKSKKALAGTKKRKQLHSDESSGSEYEEKKRPKKIQKIQKTQKNSNGKKQVVKEEKAPLKKHSNSITSFFKPKVKDDESHNSALSSLSDDEMLEELSFAERIARRAKGISDTTTNLPDISKEPKIVPNSAERSPISTASRTTAKKTKKVNTFEHSSPVNAITKHKVAGVNTKKKKGKSTQVDQSSDEDIEDGDNDAVAIVSKAAVANRSRRARNTVVYTNSPDSDDNEDGEDDEEEEVAEEDEEDFDDDDSDFEE